MLLSLLTASQPDHGFHQFSSCLQRATITVVYLKKITNYPHGCLSVMELLARVRYNLHGDGAIMVISKSQQRVWINVTSNGVTCHVKTLWLLAPAKLWLFTGKSANISGCLPVTEWLATCQIMVTYYYLENISMVVYQFHSCLLHVQILVVYQYKKKKKITRNISMVVYQLRSCLPHG